MGNHCIQRESFERIREAWDRCRQQQFEQEQASAPRFNVFRMLKVERAEARLHSPFLRDLLDPYGSHGQGAAFLKSFLKMLSHTMHADRDWLGCIADALEERPPSDQWLVQTERERIDVSIRNNTLGILLFLENKIDAPEQERQLERYRSILERSKDSYPFGRLIFLTRSGYGDTQSGDPHVRLYYEEHITDWLKALAQRDKLPARVKGTLLQYMDIVCQFRDGGIPDMQDDLANLLSNPENIRCGLEVERAMPEAKRILRLRFWMKIVSELRRALDARSLGCQWDVRVTDTLERDKQAGSEQWLRGNGYQGVYLQWREQTVDMRAGVLVAWEKGELVVWYGVYGYNFPHKIDELAPLENIGWHVWNKIDPGDGDRGHWGACKYRTDFAVQSDDFVVRLASKDDETAAGLTQDLMQMLSSNSKTLAAIRRTLTSPPDAVERQS